MLRQIRKKSFHVFLTVYFFGVIESASAAICHFKAARDAGADLVVAMGRAKDCSSGNSSGELFFMRTMASMLHFKKQLGFDPDMLKIDKKYLGDFSAYLTSYTQMFPLERLSIEAMFWLYTARYMLQEEGMVHLTVGSPIRIALTKLGQTLREIAHSKKQKALLEKVKFFEGKELTAEESDKVRKKLSDEHKERVKNERVTAQVSKLRSKKYADSEHHIGHFSATDENMTAIQCVSPEAVLKSFALLRDIIEWPLKPHKNCLTKRAKKCGDSLLEALENIKTCASLNDGCIERFIATSVSAFEELHLNIKDLGLDERLVGDVRQYQKDILAFSSLEEQSAFRNYVYGLILWHLAKTKKLTTSQKKVLSDLQRVFENLYKEGAKAMEQSSKDKDKGQVKASEAWVIALKPSMDGGKLSLDRFVANINHFKGLPLYS